MSLNWDVHGHSLTSFQRREPSLLNVWQLVWKTEGNTFNIIEHVLHAKQLICAQEAEKHIFPLRGSEHPVCFCSFSRTCILFII